MKKEIDSFLEYLKVNKNYSEYTIISYREDLSLLDQYFVKYGIDYKNIEYRQITNFFLYLDEKKLSSKSINRILSSVRSFYKYLVGNGIVKTNFFSLVSSPKVEKALPKFLYYNELVSLFDSVDTSTVNGCRNRLILEMLYATGIRVSELVNIKFSDIDFSSKQIKILGKGNKERIVFFEDVCLKYLNMYINMLDKKCDYLFLNNRGEKLTTRGVRYILDEIIKKASFKTKISPHTLRHTFATHLLNEGCDILSVQELLGHESLKATQIYTHVTNEHLKNVYFKTHPRSGKSIDN